MAMKNGEVLAGLSEQAFRAAEALRDPHDGAGKEELLRLSCINLRSFLKIWEETKHRPVAGSLHDTVFGIFHDARNRAGLPNTSRKKMAGFARNALLLHILPGSQNREKAVIFFQRIGELTRVKSEERSSARETAVF